MSHRAAAYIVAPVGVALSAVIACWPASVTVLGQHASCGMPIRAVTAAGPVGDEPDGATEACREGSYDRLLAAALALAGTAVVSAAEWAAPRRVRV